MATLTTTTASTDVPLTGGIHAVLVPPPIDFDPAFHFSELIGVYSPGEDDFSIQSSSSRLVWWVPRDKVQACLQFLFGRATAVGTELRRDLPCRHPKYSFMYAQRANVSYAKFNAKNVGTLNPLDPARNPVPYSDYTYARITITFETIDYLIMPDEMILGPGVNTSVNSTTGVLTFTQDGISQSQEFLRFCSWLPAGGVGQYLTAEAALVFQEGPPNVKGTAVPTGFGTLQQKGLIKCVWRQVPIDFVLDGSGVMSNILNGLQCVNYTPFGTFKSDGTFAGYPAGTLLFDSMDPPVVYAAPLQTTGILQLWLDIGFNFLFYDPPYSASPLGIRRGWNLLPTRLDPLGRSFYATRVDPTQVPYPPSVTGGTLTGASLFRPYEFRKLFQKPVGTGLGTPL